VRGFSDRLGRAGPRLSQAGTARPAGADDRRIWRRGSSWSAFDSDSAESEPAQSSTTAIETAARSDGCLCTGSGSRSAADHASAFPRNPGAGRAGSKRSYLTLRNNNDYAVKDIEWSAPLRAKTEAI